MLQKIIGTTDNVAVAIVRVMLGVVMFAHGAPKLFGWFGGAGPARTLASLSTHGVPTALGWCVIIAECFGGLALIIGFLSRIAAAALAIDMACAILIVHKQFGFFMNFSGNQKGEGFEYHLLAIAMALCVLVAGAGSASVDRSLSAGAASPGRQMV